MPQHIGNNTNRLVIVLGGKPACEVVVIIHMIQLRLTAMASTLVLRLIAMASTLVLRLIAMASTLV